MTKDPEIKAAKDRVDAYLAVVERIEPDIVPVDASAYYASAAISLKRIADAGERIAGALELIIQHGVYTQKV